MVSDAEGLADAALRQWKTKTAASHPSADVACATTTEYPETAACRATSQALRKAHYVIRMTIFPKWAPEAMCL